MRFCRSLRKRLVSTSQDRQFITRVRETIEPLLDYSDLEKVTFLGSTARDTYYGKPREFDYFLSYSIRDFEYEKFVSETRRNFKSLEAELQPKNRGFPYVTLRLVVASRNVSVDLVPCLTDSEVSGPIDRTLSHHQYVTSRLTESLKFEIKRFKRVLKKFGLYGASSQTKGLSGYCCQVLILKYGRLQSIDPTLSTLWDPCDASRDLLKSLSSKTLKRFKVLLRTGFRVYNDIEVQDLNLYYMPNAPLKLYSVAASDPHVVGAVWLKKGLIIELKDLYVKAPVAYVQGSDRYFHSRKGQQLYCSEDDYYMKKVEYKQYLKRNPLFKSINEFSDRKSLCRTYNFFK